MKFALNDYIDKYIRNAKYTANKKIAQHLKEIIPQTTHLHRETFKEIIEELKMKMDNET
jgi:predicted urease superfamily metal-dependent hydrolase